MVELLNSPWETSFNQLLEKAQSELFIASPFISRRPLEQVVEVLKRHQKQRSLQINLVTSLNVQSLLSGSLDLEAVLQLMKAVSGTKVTHLPSLHAKVYIFDAHAAVVTSANLTAGGLVSNYEYGVLLRETLLVSRVKQDLAKYASLGSPISFEALDALAQVARDLKTVQSEAEKSARAKLKEALKRHADVAKEQLLQIRAAGQTTNSIFAATILYLLEQRGRLTTAELNPLVQQLHPDLCDDSIDRVIGEVHFGKKWKHHVRNAQQFLKRKNLIGYDGVGWFLVRR